MKSAKIQISEKDDKIWKMQAEAEEAKYEYTKLSGLYDKLKAERT